MRKGILAGGIILFVIGLIISVISGIFNNMASNAVQQCQTLLGQLGQGLDQEATQKCNEANAVQSVAIGGLVLGIVGMVIPGIVLIVIGAIKESKKPKEKEVKPNTKEKRLSREAWDALKDEFTSGWDDK